MPSLTRSARWVCWFNSWLAGTAPLETAIDAVVGDDAAHHVVGHTNAFSTNGTAFAARSDGAEPLLLAWSALRRAGATGATLALPAPGDPYGLAGPADFTAAAADAEEAVVVEGVGAGLIPQAVGAGVFWQVHPANPCPPTAGVGEASRTLRTSLATTADALLDLDVARWQPEVREALAGIREKAEPLLAPGYDPRAEELAATALRCQAITSLATASDSGAVTAWEDATRFEHLRSLAGAARRALVVACNAGRPR